MNIRFYNSMTRTEEVFKPRHGNSVGMYTCGPTVYNFAHIGNFRAYVFEDLLRRVLEFFGYDVTQVMNLTDVDDKTIRGAKSAGIPLGEYTEPYKQAFFNDMAALRIERAEVYPAATDHIPEMIALVQILLDKGVAYKSSDGSVYFSIDKFPDYGKLSKVDLDSQRAGERVKLDEYAKDSVADFALWKAWDENDGDVFWESPWGKGRPGWHIECSAMSMKYLGETFDIHTGGIDNMFPHHEDEIAQSEAATGKTFVHYWLHCGYLVVNGEKMSKSLGNFFTLRDLREKGWSYREIRAALLSGHYRKMLDFSERLLEQTRSVLTSLDELFDRLARRASGGESPDGPLAKTIEQADKAFAESLAADLNIAGAWAAVHALAKQSNKALDSNDISTKDAENALDAFRKFDQVLNSLDVPAPGGGTNDTPEEVATLVEQRAEARKAKDFAAADAIRDKLLALGWTVKDTPDGPVVKPTT